MPPGRRKKVQVQDSPVDSPSAIAEVKRPPVVAGKSAFRQARAWRAEAEAEAEANEEYPSYWAIAAPPSARPPRHYCDITGFEAPYTDPRTQLRFCNAHVYQFIQNMTEHEQRAALEARAGAAARRDVY
jgi:hypothetical protein